MYKDSFIKDCFLSALTLLAKESGIEDTSYLYIPYLGFEYKRQYVKTGDIGQCINNRWDGKLNGGTHWILNKNSSLEIITQKSISFAECKSLIMKGHHLMIWSDVFHCPWTMFYKKRSFKHVYLITGIYKDYFIIKDEFFGISNYHFDANYAYENFINVNMVNIYKEDKRLHVIKNKMRLYLEKYKMTINYSYRDFREDLLTLDISKQKVQDNNYYGNMILTKLKNLSRYRYGYAKFLEQLEIDFNVDLQETIRDLEKLGELWSRLVLILLRIFIKGMPNSMSMQAPMNLISQIACLENKVLDGLLKFCCNCFTYNDCEVIMDYKKGNVV